MQLRQFYSPTRLAFGVLTVSKGIGWAAGSLFPGSGSRFAHHGEVVPHAWLGSRQDSWQAQAGSPRYLWKIQDFDSINFRTCLCCFQTFFRTFRTCSQSSERSERSERSELCSEHFGTLGGFWSQDLVQMLRAEILCKIGLVSIFSAH